MTIIKLKLNKEDLVAFQLFVASNSERLIKKRKQTRMRLPIVYIFLALVMFYNAQVLFGSFLLAFSILWFYYYPMFESKKYVKHYSSYVNENFKSKLDLETKLEFTDEEIRTYDNMGSSIIKNETITHIDETLVYIFIRLETGMGIILPKSKIKNLDELEKWIDRLSIKYKISKNVNLDWVWK